MKAAVARTDDVPPGGLLGVIAGDTELCIVHTADGGFYVIDDNCTHEDCPLSDGDVDGFTVECPCHGSRFDVRTGDVLNLPATEPVQTYPAEVVGGEVVVTLED